MSELHLILDWENAPGVAHPVLARTWARLEVWVGDRCLTRVIDERSESARNYVYGTAFPLVAWLVRNWWFILHEPAKAAPPFSARHLGRFASHRGWLHRHALLSAREGMALPDCLVYRDGPAVAVRWTRDPPQQASSPVRFVNEGHARVEPQSVERAVDGVVDKLLGRLDGVRHPEVEALQSEYEAVRASRQDESPLCIRSAKLGLDPYDPDELTEPMAELLEGDVAELEQVLQQELLEAAPADRLRDDLVWLERTVERLGPAAAQPRAPRIRAPQAADWAHELGYARARAAREQLLRLPATAMLGDMDALLRDRCHWGAGATVTVEPSPSQRLDGVVQTLEGRAGRVALSERSNRAKRFLLARALHATEFLPSSRWLLTGAPTWEQRVGRAFAAELLAPAEALRARVASSSGGPVVRELAEEFDVASLVIRHQLDNHGIYPEAAWLEDGEADEA